MGKIGSFSHIEETFPQRVERYSSKNSTAAHCGNIRCHTAMKYFNTLWNHEETDYVLQLIVEYVGRDFTENSRDYVLQHTSENNFHTLLKHFHTLRKQFHSLLMDIYKVTYYGNIFHFVERYSSQTT